MGFKFFCISLKDFCFCFSICIHSFILSFSQLISFSIIFFIIRRYLMNLLQSMNYEEFLDQVRTMAEHRTGGEAQVTIRPILKNNNLRLDGLLILYPGENISPALYLNQYYARYLGGIPMEMILDEIFATYESCRCPDRFDLDQLRDFDALKKHLSVRLISRSANEALLQTVPYIPFLDLAAVFSLTIDTGSLGTSTIQVRNEYLEFWNVDTEALYRTALENLRSQDAPAFFPLSSLAPSAENRFFPPSMSLQTRQSSTAPPFCSRNEL